MWSYVSLVQERIWKDERRQKSTAHHCSSSCYRTSDLAEWELEGGSQLYRSSSKLIHLFILQKVFHPFLQLSPRNQFLQVNIPINMQFSATLITLGASIVAAAPSTPETRQFEGFFGGGGFSLCTTAFQTAQCCDISIDGVLNLNCHACMYSISILSQLNTPDQKKRIVMIWSAQYLNNRGLLSTQRYMDYTVLRNSWRAVTTRDRRLFVARCLW
jgi:hypothetical protein